MSQPLRTSQGKNGKNENNAITQLKMVLLCALVHSFLRFEERIEIIRQNPKLLPNWYSSWLALLPLFPDSFFVTISLDMASCIMEQRLVADGEAGADAEKN